MEYLSNKQKSILIEEILNVIDFVFQNYNFEKFNTLENIEDSLIENISIDFQTSLQKICAEINYDSIRQTFSKEEEKEFSYEADVVDRVTIKSITDFIQKIINFVTNTLQVEILVKIFSQYLHLSKKGTKVVSASKIKQKFSYASFSDIKNNELFALNEQQILKSPDKKSDNTDSKPPVQRIQQIISTPVPPPSSPENIQTSKPSTLSVENNIKKPELEAVDLSNKQKSILIVEISKVVDYVFRNYNFKKFNHEKIKEGNLVELIVDDFKSVLKKICKEIKFFKLTKSIVKNKKEHIISANESKNHNFIKKADEFIKTIVTFIIDSLQTDILKTIFFKYLVFSKDKTKVSSFLELEANFSYSSFVGIGKDGFSNIDKVKETHVENEEIIPSVVEAIPLDPNISQSTVPMREQAIPAENIVHGAVETLLPTAQPNNPLIPSQNFNPAQQPLANSTLSQVSAENIVQMLIQQIQNPPANAQNSPNINIQINSTPAGVDTNNTNQPNWDTLSKKERKALPKKERKVFKKRRKHAKFLIWIWPFAILIIVLIGLAFGVGSQFGLFN